MSVDIDGFHAAASWNDFPVMGIPCMPPLLAISVVRMVPLRLVGYHVA